MINSLSRWVFHTRSGVSLQTATLMIGESSGEDGSQSVFERETECEYVIAETLGPAALNLAYAG